MIEASAHDFRPLTPDRTADFVALFGSSGACYGCWCTHFRLRPKVRQEFSGNDKRAFIEARIAAGPPPGLLAFRENQPVGWMQIGPRADIPEWNNPRRATTPQADAPADDPSVWAISCFFFRSSERGQGLSHHMVAAGLDFARENGARLVEASPMDCAKQSRSIGLFVGSTSVFQKAGFVEITRAKPGRPLMRYTL